MPNNFYVLVSLSALFEAISTYLFKISNSRGWLSVLAYICGFLVVGFYGEALRYSKLSQSYPIWLVLVAVLITASSFFLLKEHVRFGLWMVGFGLVVAGIIFIQFSLPSE